MEKQKSITKKAKKSQKSSKLSKINDLLASIKTMHGIKNDNDKEANKKNVVAIPKKNSTKVKNKQSKESSSPIQKKIKEKRNKIRKPVKNGVKEAIVTDAGQLNVKAKVSKNQSKNLMKQKKPKNKVKSEKGANESNNELLSKDSIKNDSMTIDTEEKEQVKNEYFLKNAVPVFVGNLPTNIKRLKLVKMFKKFGKILSIRFRTNNGKSFMRKAQLIERKVPYLIAFIYFENREAAEASLALNGEKCMDNIIRVDLDTNEIKKSKMDNTVVVGNLKYAVTENILNETFKSCGEIDYIRIPQSPKGCKGVAYICFKKAESCGLALKLNGILVLDREIRVEKYREKKQSEKNKEIPKKNKLANKAIVKSKDDQLKYNGNQQKTQNLIQRKKKDTTSNKIFVGVKSKPLEKTNKKNVIKKKKKLTGEKLLAKKVASMSAF